MDETPLRKVRLALGVTQMEVSKAIGIDQSTYSKIEAGEKASADVAAKIAAFFGEPLTEIHVLYPDRFTRFMEKAP